MFASQGATTQPDLPSGPWTFLWSLKESDLDKHQDVKGAPIPSKPVN